MDTVRWIGVVLVIGAVLGACAGGDDDGEDRGLLGAPRDAGPELDPDAAACELTRSRRGKADVWMCFCSSDQGDVLALEPCAFRDSDRDMVEAAEEQCTAAGNTGCSCRGPSACVQTVDECTCTGCAPTNERRNSFECN